MQPAIDVAHGMLRSEDMRVSAGVVITIGIVAVVVLQKHREPAAPQQPTQTSAAPAVAGSVAAPEAQAIAQHWPKSALDRAADVRRQVAEQRKSDGTR